MKLIEPGSNSFTLAKPEQVPVPGRLALMLPLAPAWLWLALCALGLGLLWRLTGMAPDLATVLDGWSVVLWLTALMTAPAWNTLLNRRNRHGRHGLRFVFRHVGDAGFAALAGLALSLAGVGLLTAYNPRAHLPGLNAFSLDLALPTWAWFLGVLVIAGPALALLSLALLHLARRLWGTSWGTLCWLTGGLLVHRNLVIGEILPASGGWPPLSPAPVVLDPDILVWPVALGDFARWWALVTAQTTNESVFIGEFLLNLVRTPVSVTAAALVVLVVLTRPLPGHPRQLPLGWLAAVAAVLAVTVRTAAQCWLWTADLSRIFPGSWYGLFGLGIGTVWLIWLAGELFYSRRAPHLNWQALIWPWFALSALTVLTLPGIESGQTTHRELALAALAALPVLTLGLLAINFTARSGGSYGRLGLAGLTALLVMPLPAGDGVLSPALLGWQLLAAALAQPGQNYLAWGAFALACACCLALWPRPRTIKAKPATGNAGTI